VADYLVQEEDGTSRLTLEEGSGSILLEESIAGATFDAPTPGFPLRMLPALLPGPPVRAWPAQDLSAPVPFIPDTTPAPLFPKLPGYPTLSSPWRIRGNPPALPGFTPVRVSQFVAETLTLPSTAKARASQLPAETLVLPTTSKARASQLPIETLLLGTAPKARASQLVVEVLKRDLRRETFRVWVED
jgi:hypothetical protein